MKVFIRKNSESPIVIEHVTSHYQLDAPITDLHRTTGELGHVAEYYSNKRPAYTPSIMSLRITLKQPNSPEVIRNSVLRALDWCMVVHGLESSRKFTFSPFVLFSGQTGRSFIIVHRISRLSKFHFHQKFDVDMRPVYLIFHLLMNVLNNFNSN